jgi:hypothetical protein
VATSLRRDECELCGEEMLVGWLVVKDAKGVEQHVKLKLQPEEVQVFSELLGYVVGHERHWKYCEKRLETGMASSDPEATAPAEDSPAS